MRFRKQSPPAAAGLALLVLGLGACNFGRNVADDCWIDRAGLQSANEFRLGLKARNVPTGAGAWAVADARIARAREKARACEDGAPGAGRPRVEELSSGHEPGDGGA